MTSPFTSKIAIIGDGLVGRALGGGLIRAGHSVVYGVRTPSADDQSTVPTAVEQSDIVILAVPFGAIDAVVTAAGDWSDKVVIDCTNPLEMRDGRLALSMGFSTSGAEIIAAKIPQARIVKTLNQTGAENMADARPYATPPVMFVAGDDAEGVATASRLVRDLGFEPVTAGPLAMARLLEPLAMLWIDQALYRGAGRRFAFARETLKPNG